jgi:hypothetical protein
MYHSAVASYTYPNCPAVDMIGSIQVEFNGLILYRPLLVSVKCWATMYPADAIEALKKLRVFLATIRENNVKIPALCLLVLIGYEKPVNVQSENLSGYLNDDLGDFPNDDAYRIVNVPDDDSFGVSSSLRETTAEREIAEIYTSHPFFYGEPSLTGGAVLRGIPKFESLKYANELHSAFSKSFTVEK